jgi:Haem-degrading
MASCKSARWSLSNPVSSFADKGGCGFANRLAFREFAAGKEQIMHVTIADAEIAITAARKRAMELSTKMCIAIVDSGANLKAFHRMDDARVGSIVLPSRKQKQQSSSACRLGKLASSRSRAARFMESNIPMRA